MRWFARRIVFYVFALWVALTINFLLPRMMPGSPIDGILQHLTPAQLRRHLGNGWELVSASFLPLAVLLVAGLLGTTVSTAVLAALICATVLLSAAGWRVGRQAGLTRRSRLLSAMCSGAFGGAMILLKSLLH